MEQWNLKGEVVCDLSFSAAALKSLHWNFPEGFLQHCNHTFLYIYLFNCVRGTRTQPLICVGCSVHYWVSCAINKGRFFRICVDTHFPRFEAIAYVLPHIDALTHLVIRVSSAFIFQTFSEICYLSLSLQRVHISKVSWSLLSTCVYWIFQSCLLKMCATAGACINETWLFSSAAVMPQSKSIEVCSSAAVVPHKVNLQSCVVGRRPLCHKVNLPRCETRRRLCHKVNQPRCEARRRHQASWLVIFSAPDKRTF